MALRPGELLIDDSNAHQFMSPTIDGEVKGHGLVPRDWSKVPCGSIPGAPEATVQKIPRSEWSARIKEMEDKKELLSNIRDVGMFGQRIPSRDQNGKGYCWAHSTTSAALLARAKDNQPYVDLSAYAIACVIKNFYNEGGFNAESMQFLRERGCPSSDFWAQRSMSRSNDNPKTWENAALHKMTNWIDINEGDFDMQMTLLLMGYPHALDLNWWSHSICAADPVEVESGSFGIRIWNSWGEGYGTYGMAVLRENKATNNGAIALTVMEAAVV